MTIKIFLYCLYKIENSSYLLRILQFITPSSQLYKPTNSHYLTINTQTGIYSTPTNSKLVLIPSFHSVHRIIFYKHSFTNEFISHHHQAPHITIISITHTTPLRITHPQQITPSLNNRSEIIMLLIKLLLIRITFHTANHLLKLFMKIQI